MGEGDKRARSSPKGGGGIRRISGDSTRELSRLCFLAGKMFIAVSHAALSIVEC